MSEHSNDPRFYDFDAAFAERQPIPFRLLGKDWSLPASAPAKVILRVQRLMADLTRMMVSGEVDEDMVIDEDLSYERMSRLMIGDDIVDAWLDAGIDYDMFQAVTRRLYAIYTGDDPDGDTEDDGEGGGPKAKPGKKPQDRKKPKG